VRAVIDEKFFILIAGAEVAPQDREHTVFGFDLAAQDSAQFGKPDKSFQQMGLRQQMLDSFGDRVQDRVRKISQEARALPQELHHQPVHGQLLFRQAGEETLLQ